MHQHASAHSDNLQRACKGRTRAEKTITALTCFVFQPNGDKCYQNALPFMTVQVQAQTALQRATVQAGGEPADASHYIRIILRQRGQARLIN